MTIRLERPTAGRLDYEFVWLLVLGATGIVSAAWLLLPLPTPQCLFHTITGLPCPTCGGTRCVRSLLAGNFHDALAWNPLVLLSLVAAGLYAAYAFIVVTLRLPRIRLGTLSRAQGNALRISAALILAANWIYLIYRFSHLA